jgi:pimeloyl-ACP methyl ester carboxylesterase
MSGAGGPIYTSAAGAREVERRYREALDRWPVPREHLRVPTCEGPTFVVASGRADAPPVLLLHGSGTNSAIWRDDAASWAEHLRVYAVDVIGEPGLSAPSRPPLDSEAYALWLDDVLDGLGAERTSIVGASLGGRLAADYAIRRPGRVDRLVLLCPGGIGRHRRGWMVAAVLLAPFGRAGRRGLVRLITGLGAAEAREFLDHMAATFAHFIPRRSLPTFTDGELGRLAAPTLLIIGTRDAMVDARDTAARLTRTVPHAEVRLLPGVGHAIVGQTATVLAFLRGA